MFVFLWIVQSDMLIALNRQKSYLLLMVLATLFNVPLSILTIIYSGYVGYAAISVITYIVVLVGATLSLYKETGYFLSPAKMIKVTIYNKILFDMILQGFFIILMIIIDIGDYIGRCS